MVYVKAVFLAVALAIALGVVAGVFVAGWGAFDGMPAADKAVVLSIGLSEAMNCAAMLALAFVPAAIAVVFLRRRRHR